MHGLFGSLKFKKTGKEIKAKAQKMVAEWKQKIEEKRKALDRLVKEYKIDVVGLLNDMDSLRGYSNKVMPSQELEKLKNLAERIDALKSDVKRTELIIRNLGEEQECELTFDELEYFRF